MKTGSLGTFVISWSQTETDGLKAASLDVLNVGAAWRWTGEAVRVDGSQAVLVLDGAEGSVELRQRAARMVHRLVGAAIHRNAAVEDTEDPGNDLPDQSFIVTDGRQSHVLTVIDLPERGVRLVMALGEMPPRDHDLWVVRASVDRSVPRPGAQAPTGVICFAPGTRIATPQGQRLIETLAPGDTVLTRDNGPQPVLWMGHRRISGARMYAMPHLRPIRLRAGAVGVGEPDRDLIVSPQHRMLVRGASARALFNTDEVLVAAQDLVNDHSILIDRSLREVTYVHVLLEHHNVIWANNLQTESLHPANTAFDSIDPVQRGHLLSLLPGIDRDPHRYGAYVRRNLSASEAAILRHDMGV
jgi:hypothetical protein